MNPEITDEEQILHDPFCDERLFLSKKIRKFLYKRSKDRIPQLLDHLHAEFKTHFPSCHLTTLHLNKIYDQTVYFHHWLSKCCSVLLPSGKVHIDRLVRYFLQSAHYLTPHGYATAMHISYKVNQCIAIIEGYRPSFATISRYVWAAYKNTLSLPVSYSFGDIDNFDRLVVKLQVHHLARDPTLSESKLSEQMIDEIDRIASTPESRFSDSITLLTSYQLAKSTPFFSAATNVEQNALIQFVRGQIDLAKGKASTCEVGRRLLALYPLAMRLPRSIPETSLRAAIRYTYCLACGRYLPACPILDPSVYALLNAQVIAFMGRDTFPSETQVTDHLIKLFAAARHLPCLRPFELESTLWITLLQETLYVPTSPLLPLIESELAHTLIHMPTCSFESIVHLTVQKLQQIKQAVDQFYAKNTNLLARVREWTVQGDMLHRWIHLETPFTDIDIFLKEYPRLIPFKEPIKIWHDIMKKAAVLCATGSKPNRAPPRMAYSTYYKQSS